MIQHRIDITKARCAVYYDRIASLCAAQGELWTDQIPVHPRDVVGRVRDDGGGDEGTRGAVGAADGRVVAVMCLIRPIDPPKRLPKKGYKRMERSLSGLWRTPWREHYLREGHWAEVLTGGSLQYEALPNLRYSAGFHCFPSRRDAERHWAGKHVGYVLVEFEIDPQSIVAWGVEPTQSKDKEPTCRVFVAQRIKLIGEVEA